MTEVIRELLLIYCPLRTFLASARAENQIQSKQVCRQLTEVSLTAYLDRSCLIRLRVSVPEIGMDVCFEQPAA